MIFSDVDSISIPQGNVAKIHETNGGRILWQKGKIYDSPRYFIHINNGNKTSQWGSSYSVSPSSKANITVVSCLSVRSALVKSGTAILFPNLEEVLFGDKFTACYVTRESEEENIPDSAKKLPDAVWTLSSLNICAMTLAQTSMQGYALTSALSNTYGLFVTTTNRPVSFSSLSGEVITVNSVASNLSTYITLYENNSGNSLYKSKSSAPYLYGNFVLSYKSTTLNSIVNGNGDSQIVFFFTIAR